MTFLDYLKLIQRHWIYALILTLIVTIGTVLIVKYKNNQSLETDIFITIGNVEDQNIPNNGMGVYENAEAADQFSQTVQGWFKDSGFIKNLNKRSGITTDISAVNQQKQNIIVTFSTGNEKEAYALYTTIREQLNNEINQFNLKTNNKFQATIFDINTEEKPLSLTLFLLIGLVGGAVLASFSLYGYEYLFQKVSTPSQAEEILKKKYLELVSTSTLKKEKQYFLQAYIEKLVHKNIQIVGNEPEINLLRKSLENSPHNKTMESIVYPQQISKITDHDHHIVVCTLGKTSRNDLGKLQKLLSETFDLVIVEA